MFKKYNNIINNADSVNCLGGNGYNYNKSKYKNSIVSVNINNNFGYNLIILSVIILIMGALMTATISYYDISNVNRRTKNTQDKFKIINTALISYLAKNGKFPCPAPLDCDSTGCNNDSDYNDSTSEDDDNKVKALGKEFRYKQANNKNCIADNSGVFESKNSDDEKLLYGNVPAISLGLDNSYLVDDWGNKLVYIVPDAITQDNALKNILLDNKNSKDNNTNSKKYVVDGEVFVLLSNNTNTSGAFPFESRTSNTFTKENTEETITYNLPKQDFVVNVSDTNYLKYYKNIDNLHEAFRDNNNNSDSDIEIAEPDCEDNSYIININVDNVVENEVKYESGDSIPSGKKVGDVIKSGDVVEYKFKKTGDSTPKGSPSCCGSSQTLKFPKGVTTAKLEVWGAEGGSAGNIKTTAKYSGDSTGSNDYRPVGGKGGYSYGTLSTLDKDLTKNGIKNRTLLVYVGGKGPNFMNSSGGWNGGGDAGSGSGQHEGGGGGATDFRKTPDKSTRILVGGGGGGASIPNENGGNGGGGNRNGGNGTSGGGARGIGGCAYNKTSSCYRDKPHLVGGGGGYYNGSGTWGKGGSGGGSGYINTAIFSNSGGTSGENGLGKNGWRTLYTPQGKIRKNSAYDGKARVTYLTISSTSNEESESYNYIINFPKAKYGEIVDSINECPRKVGGSTSKPDFTDPQALDYYYLSNNRDISGNLINNKLSRRCGKNGEFENGVIHKCIQLQRCDNPSSKFPNVDWGKYNYKIVHTGIITGKDKKTGAVVKYQCLVDIDKDGKQTANYYKYNK